MLCYNFIFLIWSIIYVYDILLGFVANVLDHLSIVMNSSLIF